MQAGEEETIYEKSKSGNCLTTTKKQNYAATKETKC